MNLPFILDVAIGLIFIYLILSLLASEIQEFIATVFQWRAKHLKESIEIILAGDSKETKEVKRASNLADKLYTSPLIENINQEAKGFFVKLPRKLTWKIGKLYRSIGRTFNIEIASVFGDGKRSGPSYIPAETFATTLMETLNLSTFVHEFSASKLENFENVLLNYIKQILINLGISNVDKATLWKQSNASGEPATSILTDFFTLETKFHEIVKDFKNCKATLETSIERMEKRLERYISSSAHNIPENHGSRNRFQDEMESLNRDFFHDKERDVLIGAMKPSLNEVVEAINKNSPICQEIIQAIEAKDAKSCQEIKQTIDDLPQSVIKSIYTLANRAQSKVEIAETDINKLRQEIEVWYDRSMERASGVYKRNAKGVAILIGFVIAVAANADTFKIASTLSKDSVTRTTVTEYAQQAVSKCTNTPSPEKKTYKGDLECFHTELDLALNNITLPIGWNLEQLKGNINSQLFTPKGIPTALKKILGWFLTGFAVSMGANFWFDLLGKVINVRNTGAKPASSTEDRPSSSSQSSVVIPLRSKD